MNISIVNKRINKLGGIERYLVELINNISILDKNVNIELYVNEIDQNDIVNVDKERLKVNHVKIRNKVKLLTSTSFCINSTKILKQKNKNSIIHAHGTSTINADIVTAHSCHKAWYKYSIKNVRGLNGKIKKIINPLHYLIMMIEKLQYSSKNLKKVVAISEVVKKELIENYGIDEEIISVIYNGTNIDEFNPKNISLYKKEIRYRHNIREDEIVLLFVAAEFNRKGLKFILEAMKNLSNVPKLMVVGGDNKNEFELLSKQYNIEQNVIFVGKTSEVEKYYAASDIFVFPTTYEAFGQVITEAMATGIPVITSKCAGASELVEDKKDAILLEDPTDIRELTEKIEKLLKNESLRNEIGKNGRKKIELYTWEKTSKEMLKLYNDIG